MHDPAALAPAVERGPVQDKPDVSPIARVRDEYAVLNGLPAGLPELNFPPVTRQEICACLIAGHVVQFGTEHMPVIQHHQPPAVAGIKAAGAIRPRNIFHPFEEFGFLHGFSRLSGPATPQDRRDGQYFC